MTVHRVTENENGICVENDDGDDIEFTSGELSSFIDNSDYADSMVLSQDETKRVYLKMKAYYEKQTPQET